MNLDILQQAGFSDKEAKIYLTLLKLGPSAASTVAKEAGFERTTTYYLLLRMVEAGTVTQVIKSGTKIFAPTKPEQVRQMLKEREELFANIVPTLQKLNDNHQQPLTVELRKGKEGLHHLYRDTLEVGGEVLCFGVDDTQYIKEDPAHLEQYYREAEKTGLRERLLTYEGALMVGTSKTSEYRFIDKKYFQPTPSFVYGDRLVLMSWEPSLHLIFIHSKELAAAFKKHFELLWKTAKKKEQ